MGRTVLGAPMFHPGALLREPEAVPVWFSFERHALLAVLEWLGRRRGAPIDTVALPDYMCHEVAATLRGRGYRVAWFPLGEGFEPDPGRIEGLPAGGTAVFMCHFYGRIARRWADLAGLCRRRGWALIEDCAHLPYPYPGAAEPFVSDARLYTFRKVYGVPYGAAALVREDAAGFAAFLAGRGQAARDPDGAGVLAWAARETLKRAVVAAGVTVSRGYRDLSSDPLKPFDRAHRWAERLLPAGAWRDSARRRRANYLRYRDGRAVFEGWADFPEHDTARDVPYQLLLHLRPGLAPRTFIDFMLARGVAALAGLALDEQVLGRLPPDHAYRRQAALPLHQDVSARDVDAVLGLCREFRSAQPAMAGRSER